MKLVLRWIAPLRGRRHAVRPRLRGRGSARAGPHRPDRPAHPRGGRDQHGRHHGGRRQTYAAREKQAAGLEQWQGGAAGASIYLGGSALALALLLVILLVLL